MRNVTAAGRDVDEAVQSGLRELQLTRDEVDITVIEEGNKGFLGIFGKKPAIVKLAEKFDPIQETRIYLKRIAEFIAGKSDVTVKESKKAVCFHITGEKAALLIGKRGQTLNALQTLTQLVLNRYSDQYKNVTVDAENYRSKRKDTLSQLAVRLADQVLKTKKDVHLEPMPSSERKIIHDALSKYANQQINTYSMGEGDNRHLVISQKR
ncbi:RNA-binding cell elongation regulator Jag/EloR [Bacillus mojavensis]|uniref:RNA-binding cell elongation regulator Jag/EloR n=1 Tax=Bacillus mojavensis TaxID=72360 RepID=UPI002DB74C61|nr:RNA-binding cell elongation regulator Jag/EloR [Bacillus mojavensis]MEC1611896.1 RNA-binding cell elongation regulator Jag/EloR [Bacillus mojavensis]MEC1621505.1 RNA-binding cell elongation regulator Jag/EloR [Bacillus mojavensis]MEC1659857.1 RNA-binding cell elongation regulator Jag/EloR [Bacillus mojavensis]MEC1683751.1 RNA-binding cell elongation regulator Jag/EloR [Bacillus mojavensis]MEC1690698.1 RNA-binding cell elongation regulator Jag/EloR [Bacillus mojavensis]